MVDDYGDENVSSVRLISGARAKANRRYLVETGGRQFVIYAADQLDALRKFEGCNMAELRGLARAIKVDRSPKVRSNTDDIDKRKSF